MSGPKVFRVVTKEEFIASCEADLRRLDAVIAEWTKRCERGGAADEAASKAISERRDAFRRMLAEDRFAELQKQVPSEMSYLRSDTQLRIERAAAAQAQAAQNRRRTARAARMLLEALDKTGRDIPTDLRRDLQSSETSDKAIADAFALLSTNAVEGAATERQCALAAELGRGEKRATLAEWLARQPGAAERDSDRGIDRHLAELSALGVDPSPFAAHAAALNEAPPARQGLLADSLLVELAKAVNEGRTKAAHLADLRERDALLARHESPVARDLRARIAAAIASGDTSSTPSLIEQADALSREALRAVAADARRRTVLQGLAILGYEVNEGMATAWVQGGQVVLRKAANPGYGVELGGGTKSDRLQVRAVAFGSAAAARDTSRDRDIETVWCSEFEQLRSLVSSSGGDIEIEHALPIGAMPLKVIEDAQLGGQSDEVIAPRFRQQ